MLLQPVDRRPLNVTGWSRFDKQAMTLGLDQETKYEHMSSLFIHHISLNQSGQFIYFLVRFHISQSNLQLVIWGFFVQNERDLAALIWSLIKVHFTLSELSHSLSFFHFWNTLGEHNEVYRLTCRTVLLLTQHGDSSCSVFGCGYQSHALCACVQLNCPSQDWLCSNHTRLGHGGMLTS